MPRPLASVAGGDAPLNNFGDGQQLTWRWLRKGWMRVAQVVPHRASNPGDLLSEQCQLRVNFVSAVAVGNVLGGECRRFADQALTRES